MADKDDDKSSDAIPMKHADVLEDPAARMKRIADRLKAATDKKRASGGKVAGKKTAKRMDRACR